MIGFDLILILIVGSLAKLRPVRPASRPSKLRQSIALAGQCCVVDVDRKENVVKRAPSTVDAASTAAHLLRPEGSDAAAVADSGRSHRVVSVFHPAAASAGAQVPRHLSRQAGGVRLSVPFRIVEPFRTRSAATCSVGGEEHVGQEGGVVPRKRITRQ